MSINCIYDATYICKECLEPWPGTKQFSPESCRKICSVLSKKIQVKPKISSKPLNYIKALSKFIASSIWHKELQFVNGNQYLIRLEECASCDHRHPEKPECGVCGCKIKGIFNKAQLKTEKCPLGKWPILYETPGNSL